MRTKNIDYFVSEYLAKSAILSSNHSDDLLELDSADEVVGYFLYHYGDLAYEQWCREMSDVTLEMASTFSLKVELTFRLYII